MTKPENGPSTEPIRILVAEDERISRRKLERQLEQMGHDVDAAVDGKQAWEMFQSNPTPIVICDWEMPEMSGLELVKKIRESKGEGYVYIVMLTGKSDTKDVVAGMEAGADDFISKPFDRAELRARLNAGKRIVHLEHHLAASNRRLQHELTVARELTNSEYRKHEEALLGDSIAIRALREGIEIHAAHDDPLLLMGPMGAGQEAVARSIHRSSHRNDRPFIHVACAHAATNGESLFGESDEADEQGHIGKAMLADGGTLYLDNIESLPAIEQSQLGKFLQQASAIRSAGELPTPDIHVIAYSSLEPAFAVRDGKLHPLLEQTLTARRLTVPSLAERRDDITAVADRIAANRASNVGKAIGGLNADSKKKVQEYSWPGNVRELRSVVERAVVLATGVLLDIPDDLLQAGRRLGSYRLEKKMGAGAMGEVWLGHHSLIARPAAVKVIREDALASSKRREKVLARFEREARATAQLRSPHTVELYDFGVSEDGDLFYVMEYLHGVDLQTLIQHYDSIPPGRAIHFLRQACLSLSEAHSAGLVHRDIKPANLFACELGTESDFLKVLDFGVVRHLDNQDTFKSVDGELTGTPLSMAPELIEGEDATPKADIYSLGCVAHWLLTGQHLFTARSILGLLREHTCTIPDPPSAHNPAVPAELDAVIMRCLEKRPEDRPENAHELRQLLQAVPVAEPWDELQSTNWWDKHRPDWVDAPKKSQVPSVDTVDGDEGLDTTHDAI